MSAQKPTATTPDEVIAKLAAAELRMTELLALNGGDVAGAAADDRDRLLWEFVFHLVSATEVLAQYANEVRQLQISPYEVGVERASAALGANDQEGVLLGELYVNVGRTPFPDADPYDEQALVYRLLHYRHHVTHRQRTPFLITWPARGVHLHLDPMNPKCGGSRDTIQVELPRMLDVVRRRCLAVLDSL